MYYMESFCHLLKCKTIRKKDSHFSGIPCYHTEESYVIQYFGFRKNSYEKEGTN